MSHSPRLSMVALGWRCFHMLYKLWGDRLEMIISSQYLPNVQLSTVYPVVVYPRNPKAMVFVGGGMSSKFLIETA